MPGGAEPRNGRAQDYTKERTLGKGSFGTASLCRRVSDGQPCVIKAINLGALTDKDRSNAEREVAILQTLDHPNVIRYHESFLEEGVLCIVTEYADGGDLAVRIKKHRAGGGLIPEELVLSWAIQLVLALKYLHDQKILHRDLKPANIFLTTQNIVKLGDFGVSTVLRASARFAETFCGTPYYLSPEVCEEKPYNNKADMWALGCCLYEAMALRRPFEAKNILQLADRICRAEFDPLPEAYSADLRSFVEVLLQRLPVVRPNVQRLLKLSVVQRNLRLVGDDLLDAEKYQRALGTENIARAQAAAQGRRRTQEQQEADEKAMLNWLAQDREQLAAVEQQEVQARNDFLRRSGSNASELSSVLSGLEPTPQPTPHATPARGPINLASPPSAAALPPAGSALRDGVAELLAKREAAYRDGAGLSATPARAERRRSAELRDIHSHVMRAQEEAAGAAAAAGGDDEDFTDQCCVFADLLRSHSTPLDIDVD